MMVADIAQALSNALILSGIVRLTQGTPIRRFVPGMLGSSGPIYVGYGIIGFLFVVLWIPAGVGPFSALLILAPLFVARWAFVQYGDEERAHERTLSALVAAVETKDLYTRGHSERVAVLCELMASSLVDEPSGDRGLGLSCDAARHRQARHPDQGPAQSRRDLRR